LSLAVMFDTVFRRVDLSEVRGLEEVIHHGPSTIGVDTLLRSRGRVPSVFLEGVGLPPDSIGQLIDWARRYGRKRNFDSVFLSYGKPDEDFARRLQDALLRSGVQTFFFPRSARPGEHLHRVMRMGINQYDRVVLVCSRASLDRPGVLNEIEETLAREAREGGASILIPIRLDDYVLTDWAPRRPDLVQAVRDRVVADFRGPMDQLRIFEDAFAQLLEALERAADVKVRPPNPGMQPTRRKTRAADA
jgi:hypothetical protein